MSEEHDIKSSEEAARVSSEVTPNPKFKKIKEKISFLILLVCCVGLILWCLSPVKKNITSLNTSGDSASHDGTLAQNLELISQMEAQKTALQNKLNSLPRERIMQPPKLRSIQSNVDGNHETLSKELRARMNAPTSFAMDSASANSSEDNTGHHAILTGKDANSQFINQQNEVVSVSAKRLLHPDLTIPAGELIPAILEVAINSELPGMIRAVTTRDIYSLTGNNCLIPKGSTLTGQFNSGVVQGQSRLLAVWDRARMPDGIIVTLNSPSTDTLGRSGIDVDHINRHFFQRFGSSVLLSVLGGVAANDGVNGTDEYNSKAQYRMTIASSLQKASSTTLEEDMNIKPTLSKNQGAPINVFVAFDLDFSSVGAGHCQTRSEAYSWKP